ncbi:class I SAM-dependent methyltransferase [Natranaerobius thermophilus]|uniref:Methyltransferase type 11 n=1 Tax=Natranaerobius thermophilus (strain ATCC BAA-1301 / DSM 18059 / JW/NM-WN-LF) TaxID=457570 RepID=B2A7M5_NATTJ|nr:class I SAM-dependent methyltransferase [Natranaerobius thermophilus]ACB85734.1 Methyltransferase type 11 [Natranaerobius thermophilus JW/NM-WN-LF]
MKRKVINWKWEDSEAQKSFIEWQGFPSDEDSLKEVEEAEGLTGIRPGAKILDLGCGNGRHAIELAKKGYSVVGIDVAELYLEEARKRSQKEGLQIEYRLQRGSELTETDEYDMIFAYNHTLGFMSPEELMDHFAKIYKALKPQGVFFLKTAGPQIKPDQTTDQEKDWAEQEDKFIMSEKSIVDGYRYEKCIVIDLTKEEIIEYREKQRAFSFEEVKNVLTEAGFSKIDSYKDLQGNQANRNEFGVYICKK